MTTSTHVSAVAAAAAMQGVLNALAAHASPARVDVFGGVQPAPGAAGAGPLVCATVLQQPPGAVDVDGGLVLAVPSSGAIVFAAVTPTWARLFDGAGAWYLDFKARVSTTPDDPDDPAVLVVVAPVLEVGALVRIVAGSVVVTG